MTREEKTEILALWTAEALAMMLTDAPLKERRAKARALNRFLVDAYPGRDFGPDFATELEPEKP